LYFIQDKRFLIEKLPSVTGLVKNIEKFTGDIDKENKDAFKELEDTLHRELKRQKTKNE